MKNIAVLASGSGTNAENLARYFKDHDTANIALIATNNPEAGVIDRADNLGIPVIVFTRTEMQDGTLLNRLKEFKIDLVVLAGFLLLIPENLLDAFPDRIINIHPALLPKYGGKGMYGQRVHEAVIDNLEKESGITIHLVDPNYDEGKILFQAITPVVPDDTPESLAGKIHQLEYRYFPDVIETFVLEMDQADTR